MLLDTMEVMEDRIHQTVLVSVVDILVILVAMVEDTVVLVEWD